MDQENNTSDISTLAQSLAQATQSLASALSNLDSQFASLHAKIDRIVAAVDDGELQASSLPNPALHLKLAELEKAGVQRVMLQWMDLEDLEGLEALRKVVGGLGT